MKTIVPLLSGLILTAGASANEALLDLSKPPTFGEMTKAGMKFPVPSWLGELARSSRNDNAHPGQQNVPGVPVRHGQARRALTMEANPLAFALKQADRKGENIAWKTIQCVFPAAEQADPGNYYPPKLPIIETTRISSITLTATGDPDSLMKQAAATVKVLGISDAKLDTWVASELWKNTSGFKNTYEDQSPAVEIYLGVEGREGSNATGSFQITVDWSTTAQ